MVPTYVNLMGDEPRSLLSSSLQSANQDGRMVQD